MNEWLNECSNNLPVALIKWLFRRSIDWLIDWCPLSCNPFSAVFFQVLFPWCPRTKSAATRTSTVAAVTMPPLVSTAAAILPTRKWIVNRSRTTNRAVKVTATLVPVWITFFTLENLRRVKCSPSLTQVIIFYHFSSIFFSFFLLLNNVSVSFLFFIRFL